MLISVLFFRFLFLLPRFLVSFFFFLWPLFLFLKFLCPYAVTLLMFSLLFFFLSLSLS